ncbi:hypothetical protein [Pseudomonas sp. dw_358]|uniref:phage neck terminator protein n=1 Tax=Pseudomonas sp. dw_358 TaxID=2720083 RepID=UPI001BD5D525|nr:hypothetical protein [Pseudomonas sp. dw_358]
MRDINELNPIFQQVVALLTGADLNRVILANQGKPMPGGTALSASYLLVPIKAYGWPTLRYDDAVDLEPADPSLGDWTDYDVTMQSTMIFTLSVNIFNEGAATAAMSLPNGNFRADIAALLRQYRIGWFQTSPPRNLTVLQNAGIQPRYQCDLTLYAEVETTYAVLRAAGFSYEVSDALTKQKLQSGQYNGS